MISRPEFQQLFLEALELSQSDPEACRRDIASLFEQYATGKADPECIKVINAALNSKDDQRKGFTTEVLKSLTVSAQQQAIELKRDLDDTNQQVQSLKKRKILLMLVRDAETLRRNPAIKRAEKVQTLDDSRKALRADIDGQIKRLLTHLG